MANAVFLVRGTEIGKQIVLTRLLHLGAYARDFPVVVVRRVRFVQNVVLLVLHVHAPEAVFQVLAEDAELAVAAIMRMETKVAGMTGRTMNALVGPLTLKAVTEIAAVFVTIRLDAKKTIFECK